MTTRRPYLPVLPFAAALAAFAFVGSAQAFTFENQDGAGGGGKNGDTSMFYNSKPATDPSDRMTSRFDDGSKKTIIKQGNATFYIGGPQQSFDQRYNTDNLFNPNGGPGDTYGR